MGTAPEEYTARKVGQKAMHSLVLELGRMMTIRCGARAVNKTIPR